jgi:hypothetical protein
MESFGIIVVGPLWGLISAQLFFQTGEEFIKGVIYLLGFVRHKVNGRIMLVRMVTAFVTSIVCAILLVGGFWLICVRYPSLRTPAQNVLYLAFAVLGVVYVVSQMPHKLRKAWRHANVPGAMEEDAALDEEDEADRREVDARGAANAAKRRKEAADALEAKKE